MDRKEAAGLGYAVVAVAFFATSPVLTRWAAPLSPFAITFGRMASAALVVLVLERFSRGRGARPWQSRQMEEVGPGDLAATLGPASVRVTAEKALPAGGRSALGRFALYGLVAELHFLFYIA